MTDLSIIIVSWNVRELLRSCLNSILNTPIEPYTVEVIVVDSASVDGSAEIVRSNYPQVKLLALSENVGFTRGNNLGLAQADGRYLMLLNPDTEVIGSALAQLMTYMDANPTVGIVGPHTLNTDGSTQSTRRRFPTVSVGLFESTWAQALAPRSIMERYTASDVPDTAIADVDWVQGSALMARREIYDDIGGLDEAYIMYSEELDWCKRAKSTGWRVIYHGGAQIIHHGGKSSEQVTARKHIHFQESKLHYFRKYHGRAIAQGLRIWLLMNYMGQIFLEGMKALLGHKRDMRKERIQAYWQVLRSGLKVS